MKKKILSNSKIIKDIKSALQDIAVGIKNYQFWIIFGNNDIKSKYRRTKLGQWWITLSVAIFIFVVGGIFGSTFYSDYEFYLVYLSIGYISWLFMQECVNVGSSILTQAKPFLLQKNWPKSIFILRLIYRETLILLHHILLLPIIFIWQGFWPGINNIIVSLCGLIFTIFTAFWVTLFFSIIGIRYRDFPKLIQSLMRIVFFTTPIIWIDRNIGKLGEIVVVYNPFVYFLKIIRDPLLGHGFPSDAWILAIIISIFCILISLITLSITKDKLNYWL